MKDEHVMKALVQAAMPLVRRIAGAMVRRLPSSVERDDLISAGMLSVVESGAVCGRRIRGAMLDELRAIDPLSRGDRRALKLLERLEVRPNEDGTLPTAQQLATWMGMTVDELGRLRMLGVRVYLAMLGDSLTDGNERHSPVADGPGPDELVNRRQQARIVAEELARLPDRQRELLEHDLAGERSRSELAKRWGVSEARLSQIHADAVRALHRSVVLRRADSEQLAAGLPPVRMSPRRAEPARIAPALPLRELFSPDIVRGADARCLRPQPCQELTA